MNLESIISAVASAYKDRMICRAYLSELAIEVGTLPHLRRTILEFGDRTKFPDRPMITLYDEGPSIYLLGWREGDITAIHDHGASEVGVFVIAGRVTEDIYVCSRPDQGGNRDCLQVMSRQVAPGDLITCPQRYVHTMGNLYPEIAATLHVYGPVLDDMCLFEASNDKLMFKEHWHDENRPQH